MIMIITRMITIVNTAAAIIAKKIGWSIPAIVESVLAAMKKTL